MEKTSPGAESRRICFTRFVGVPDLNISLGVALLCILAGLPDLTRPPMLNLPKGPRAVEDIEDEIPS